MPPKRPDGPWLAANRKHPERWDVVWYDAAAQQQRRRSTGATDYAEAQIALAQFVLETQRPRKAARDAVQLVALLSWYGDEHAATIRSRDAAAAAFKWIFEEFGAERTVSDLSAVRIEAAIETARSSGLSDGTISRYLSTLRAALNHAWKRERIESVPFIPDIPKSIQAKTRSARPLDVDELRRLVQAARDYTFAVPNVGRVHSDHLFRFIVISLGTAARPEAVLQLSPFQVRWDDALIDLNPTGRRQTKKRRPTVRAPRRLMPYLQSWRDGDRFVLRNGKPIGELKSSWVTLRTAAKLPDATPYSLRHSVGRWMRRQSVPEADVQGQLGHAWSGETETYAAYDPQWMERPAAAIDALFDQIGLSGLGQKTDKKRSGK